MKFARFTLLAIVIAAFALLFAQSGPALAVTFTVNSTGDFADALPGDGVCTTSPEGGVCTLRAAIQETNALAGADTINFNIPAATDPGCVAGTGVCTIPPASVLPTITQPVTINGYSQPGASANTNPITAGSNAVLKIQLSGPGWPPGITSFSGLTISGGNSTVRGLAVNRFPSRGIFVSGLGGNTIAGNHIGTNVAGTSALGNNTEGALVDGAANNTIGGAAPADRNVISGNNGSGIIITTAGATGNVVWGNFIGTQADGVSALGNAQAGIHIGVTPANNNEIGGVAPGRANVIAFNALSGVSIGQGTGNAIRGNSIHSNTTRPGIDLFPIGLTPNDLGDADTGANNLQNFPVLALAASGGSTNIQGTLNSTANTSFNIDFYHSALCDGSGNGEGEVYLGSSAVTTDGSGNAGIGASFPGVAVTGGRVITATATRNAAPLDTSEFSNCVSVCTECDSDGDGVIDPTDNCPFWPNAAQNLPPWLIPANDPDCDGFSTTVENSAGTNAIAHCGLNAWPADINNDGFSDITDISVLTGNFGRRVGLPPPEGTLARYDIAPEPPDGWVDITDISRLTALFGQSCGL